jgi:hypothetical protein
LISNPVILETNNPPPPIIPERTSASNLNQFKEYNDASNNHAILQKQKRVSSPSSSGLGPNRNYGLMRKTSYQSERVVPNDDLALSRARAAGARNFSPRRALSPPSANNKNGLTTTKNNTIFQTPKPTVSSLSNPSLSPSSQTSNKQENIDDQARNIIYSHTPASNIIETEIHDNNPASKTKTKVRSYGADGSLLHRTDGDNNRKETENALMNNVNMSATPSIEVTKSVPEIQIQADDNKTRTDNTKAVASDEDNFESELKKPPSRREIGEVKRVADQLRKISRPEEEIVLHPKPRSPTPPRKGSYNQDNTEYQSTRSNPSKLDNIRSEPNLSAKQKLEQNSQGVEGLDLVD